MERTQDRAAREVKITDAIQNLVPHEFVGKTQPFRVHHVLPRNDDGIIQRAAQGQTIGAQIIDLFEKAEGARAADFGFKAGRIDHHRAALAGYRRCAEIDLDGNREMIGGR